MGDLMPAKAFMTRRINGVTNKKVMPSVVIKPGVRSWYRWKMPVFFPLGFELLETASEALGDLKASGRAAWLRATCRFKVLKDDAVVPVRRIK